MNRIAIVTLFATLLAGCATLDYQEQPQEKAAKPATEDKPMRLGNFSISLAVKDLKASREFYEKLGFKARGGDQKSWIILQNGAATIGLFQGMFEKNLMTFNPGWDNTAKALPEFDDVREIQKRLKAAGLKLTTEADADSFGPAHLTLQDPDGNMILLDQHVPKPAK